MTVVGCTGGESSQEVESPTHVDRQALRDEDNAWLARQAECLTELGYPARVAPELAIGNVQTLWIDPHADPEGVQQAQLTCEERIGGRPEMPLASDEELSKMYDLELEAYQCLVNHGYQPMEPSTREEYIESYYTGESWFAFLPATGTGMLPDTECSQPMPEDITW